MTICRSLCEITGECRSRYQSKRIRTACRQSTRIATSNAHHLSGRRVWVPWELFTDPRFEVSPCPGLFRYFVGFPGAPKRFYRFRNRNGSLRPCPFRIFFVVRVAILVEDFGPAHTPSVLFAHFIDNSRSACTDVGLMNVPILANNMGICTSGGRMD